MKKILLGSVALLGAAAFSGQAYAQEGLELNLSGFFVGAIGYVDESGSSTGSRDYATGSDSEIHFTGAVTLDNGLEVGFHAEGKLEEDSASDNGDFIEETFIYFDGVFGKIVFGNEDGVADQMAVVSPTLFRGNTINDAELDLSGLATVNTVLTVNGGGDDFSQKIIYFTPRLAGFQAGVSFAPEVDTDTFSRSSACGSAFCSRSEDDFDSLLELGLTYFGEFGNDVNVGASLTYLMAEDEETDSFISDDPEGWAIGVNVGFSGFTLGASYADSENIPRVEASLGGSSAPGDYQAWDIAGTYETGPWGFMLGYAEDEHDLGTFSSETTAIQGGVDYILGKGVSIGGGVQYIEEEAAISGVNFFDEDATVIFVETMINF